MALHSTFIDAGHPHMHWVGRWTSTSDGRRRDAAFPGSSVEIIITNTRSISLSLNNAVSSSKRPVEDAEPHDLDHIDLRLAKSDHIASEPVNLVVQLNDTYTTFTNARAIVPVASDLDPRNRYLLRATHMGGPNLTGRVLEFNGIWVEKLTEHPETQPAHPSNNAKNISSRERMEEAQTVQVATKRTIEILTSEISFCPISKKENQDTMINRASVWYDQLGSTHNIDAITMSTKDLRLLPSSDEMRATVSHLFFRSGPPGTTLFARPWTFTTYSPSVLILQLGLDEFTTFFADPENRNTRSRDHFINEFVNAYVKFLKAIRRTAYPFNSESLSSARKNAIDDPTYISNSAPSTLPIFLIAPFSSSGHLVTKKTRLDRIINDALSRVAQVALADGDVSTFWIDTTGWLDRKRDFVTATHDVGVECQLLLNQTGTSPHRMLNPAANLKVSTLLWDHICPYIDRDNNATSTTSQQRAKWCPFDRRNRYVGNVYLPQDVEVERTVLERRINRIKQRFKIVGTGIVID
ncbi:hypothetical protein LTS17_005982 [Exophiala oligosperma]